MEKGGEEFMKRQVVLMISIALVSFLAGTLVNTNYAATGGESRPWDRIRTSKITIVLEMNTTLTYMLFNGMSILEVYTYTITDGRPVLRYDRGFDIMMNQITVSNAYFLYPYFRIQIPMKVLISNETISIEVYNDGGTSSDLTTITFYNSHGELAASFTKYAYSASPPLSTETFYIISKKLL